jgi:hypothetical protein
MSLVDTTFGPLPGPLIQQWGQQVTFVQTTGAGTYDSATGDVTVAETRTPVKAVVTVVNPQEDQGNSQIADLKILIDPGQIGGHYISTQDWFEIPTAGVNKTAKVVDVKTYRGDNAVFFVCMARLQ